MGFPCPWNTFHTGPNVLFWEKAGQALQVLCYVALHWWKTIKCKQLTLNLGLMTFPCCHLNSHHVAWAISLAYWALLYYLIRNVILPVIQCLFLYCEICYIFSHKRRWAKRVNILTHSYFNFRVSLLLRLLSRDMLRSFMLQLRLRAILSKHAVTCHYNCMSTSAIITTDHHTSNRWLHENRGMANSPWGFQV